MSTTQNEIKGYREAYTPNTKPYQAYEKDFTNPGKFFEEEDNGEIMLQLSVWPGMYDGKKWDSSDGSSDNDSYAIHLVYRNKNRLEIIFSSAYGEGEHLKPSFEFVKQAAKEFHLLSETVIKKLEEASFEWFTKPDRPTWEEVMELYDKEAPDSRDGKTWQKIMTVSEAKELFNYLKIEVELPS